MEYKNILLTGSSGNLGGTILKSGKFQNLLTPDENEMDICDENSIKKFFQENEIDAVIHCAAIVKVGKTEEELNDAIKTNIIGTSNLVNESLKKNIRFIHISTDAAYNRTEGNYSERSPTIPFDDYGWTKLGAESSVNILKNHCIIRTSFFNPEKINFPDSPTDVFSSRIPINELIDSIKFILDSDFIGTINVGAPRISAFDLYKEFIPNLKPVRLEDIQGELAKELPKDSSMDVSLWEKLKNNNL